MPSGCHSFRVNDETQTKSITKRNQNILNSSNFNSTHERHFHDIENENFEKYLKEYSKKILK